MNTECSKEGVIVEKKLTYVEPAEYFDLYNPRHPSLDLALYEDHTPIMSIIFI